MFSSIIDDILQSFQVSDLIGSLIINNPRNFFDQFPYLHITSELNEHGLYSFPLDDHAFYQFLHFFVQLEFWLRAGLPFRSVLQTYRPQCRNQWFSFRFSFYEISKGCSMISWRRCVPRMFSRCEEAISLMQSCAEEVNLYAQASVSTIRQITVTAMKRWTLSLLIPSCLYQAVRLCRLICLTDCEMGLRMVSPGYRIRLKDPHYCNSPRVPVFCQKIGQFLHEQHAQKRQGQASLKGMQKCPTSEIKLGKQGGSSQIQSQLIGWMGFEMAHQSLGESVFLTRSYSSLRSKSSFSGGGLLLQRSIGWL